MTTPGISDIPDVVDALRRGLPVLVLDDESRENEGDAIISASLATPEWVGWMIRHTSGYICAPMPDTRANDLGLPLMVVDSQDPHGTAYTLSVDAMDRASTGISATDRSHTLNVLADESSSASSLMRPGHVLPLRARHGGVLTRRGHTEAAVDLMLLAGLPPVGALAELVHDTGEMMRTPDVIALGAREGLPVTTVERIAEWLIDHPVDWPENAETPFVHHETSAHLPTAYGDFTVHAYRDLHNDETLLALVSTTPPTGLPLVRVHSECATGDIFGSLRCECGPQLHAALAQVAAEGGVVVYLRGQEGRGIGLLEKVRAYRLQEHGLDTVDANRALGYDDDLRDYGSAAAILADLGYRSIRLLTNNPDKVAQLERHGIDVAERVPLVVGLNAQNHDYLQTKRERMGHLLPASALATAQQDDPTEGEAE